MKTEKAIAAINMRVPSHKNRLIEAACKLQGTSKTAFIIDAAVMKAEELFISRLPDFDKFDKALDIFDSNHKNR